MYEHKRQALAPKKVFYRRIFKNLGTAGLVLLVSLLIGVYGYWKFAGQTLIDAIHNASMILSGMGPVIENPQSISVGGKIFSSIYAIFSGVIFITNISFILAPAVHRFFHKLHLEEEN